MAPREREWHLTELDTASAMRLARLRHNIQDHPDIGLGYTPYRFYCQRMAVAQFACHTESELRRELSVRGLALGEWCDGGDGVRSCYLVERSA